MQSLSSRIRLAEREFQRSVIEINPFIMKEVKEKSRELMCFGVKDTNQIPESYIKRLQQDMRFAWLTIDKSSNMGRAIDTDLINPLTYKVMTGSTSGGPINILKGINDFALGTDGGGSVLGPAMSCQLPSIIGAGTNLLVKSTKVSTDQLEFKGSIGVIAKRVSILKKVMECMLDQKLHSKNETLKIIIPKKDSLIRPDGIDMHEKLIEQISMINEKYQIVEVDMNGVDDRKTGIDLINMCFHDNNADLVITFEGPIDIYGYGETIPQAFGETGKSLTRNHGKYLLRAANMAGTTAVTVPSNILASGFVIIAKKGIANCGKALAMANQLEKTINLPEVWRRYYLDHGQQFSGLSF
ncbi:hypothetical protein [Oceanobacillus sp. 1P07AA]|uniref:hypothetical protein n=1 Tax=Oceanobacillus sp. 1P07AA TaxID=3132293 RepID=UPI0039A3FFCA